MDPTVDFCKPLEGDGHTNLQSRVNSICEPADRELLEMVSANPEVEAM